MAFMNNLYKKVIEFTGYNTKIIYVEPSLAPEFMKTLHEIGLEADARMKGTDIPVPAYFYTPIYKEKREGILEKIIKKIKS